MLLINRNILVDVLATSYSIEEHVCHTDERHNVTSHIASVVCDEVLYQWHQSATYYHHHEADPQIYKALLKKYQLKASECIFIDDRLENVQAAFALGFAGIQMKDSVGTLIRSLATCNVALR